MHNLAVNVVYEVQNGIVPLFQFVAPNPVDLVAYERFKSYCFHKVSLKVNIDGTPCPIFD